MMRFLQKMTFPFLVVLYLARPDEAMAQEVAITSSGELFVHQPLSPHDSGELWRWSVRREVLVATGLMFNDIDTSGHTELSCGTTNTGTIACSDGHEEYPPSFAMQVAVGGYALTYIDTNGRLWRQTTFGSWDELYIGNDPIYEVVVANGPYTCGYSRTGGFFNCFQYGFFVAGGYGDFTSLAVVGDQLHFVSPHGVSGWFNLVDNYFALRHDAVTLVTSDGAVMCEYYSYGLLNCLHTTLPGNWFTPVSHRVHDIDVAYNPLTGIFTAAAAGPQGITTLTNGFQP